MKAKNPFLQQAIEKINQSILDKLQAGKIPWSKPWNSKGLMPHNAESGYEYKGTNFFITSFSGFLSPFWLTFNQISKLGGTVKKGSKGTMIVRWQPNVYDKKTTDKEGKETVETKRGLIFKTYIIFNEEQIDNLNEFFDKKRKGFEAKENNPLESAENIVKTYLDKPEILNKGGQACYIPTLDRVEMPIIESFVGSEEYYSTLFHELAHASGHTKRLNRESLTHHDFFGGHNYSKDELVAELSAVYLCSICGIETEKTFKNSAAYIQSWLKRLQNDTNMFYEASKEAQKVVDWFNGKKPETRNNQKETETETKEQPAEYSA